MSDAVNHPKHYAGGGIEVIDAIDAWGLGFALGNVVKYVARAEHKGHPVEDLRKASWYLKHEVERRMLGEDSEAKWDDVRREDIMQRLFEIAPELEPADADGIARAMDGEKHFARESVARVVDVLLWRNVIRPGQAIEIRELTRVITE